MSEQSTLFDVEDQTRALVDIDPAYLDVNAWVDMDPQVEIHCVLRDGQPIVFCPNRESYQAAVKAGEIAFTPAEVKRLIVAAKSAREAGSADAWRDLEQLVAKVVIAKREMPGIKLAELLDAEAK
jgi:hypothetical protein